MSFQAVEFPKIPTIKTVDAFNQRLLELGLNFRADNRVLVGVDSPLAQPLVAGGRIIGNRWCIQPMEGWDATADGRPTQWTRRRWRHFGQSGAKLIWGGEAVAVQPDGRTNPRQLLITERNVRELSNMRELLVDEHAKAFGKADDLVVGLQLTHAGRWARPNAVDRLEPRIAFRHPLLDAKMGLPADYPLVSDDWIDELIESFIVAAEMAAAAGFHLVDIKHCHGYFAHELLAAHSREGAYGGPFERRTHFLRRVCEGIRRRVGGLMIGVRLSAFDTVPHEGDAAGPGRPMDHAHLRPYRFGFGVNADDPLKIDLAEPKRFVKLCRDLGVVAVNVSAGGPYGSAHLERPAAYAAADGYGPPEDPLLGVGRLIDAAAQLKAYCPDILVIGSGYSYLQDYLAHVAQASVTGGKVDMVGLGRMALCYWQFPRDVLKGRPIQRRRICRTFSHCVSGPRRGLISGCFTRDPDLRASELGQQFRAQRQAGRRQRSAG